VQYLTFNPETRYSPERWKQLANTSDTLVFYMASKNIFGLVELMSRYAKKPQVPIAVIEQATTKHQAVYITSLVDAVKDLEGINFSSPALVIIGNVVSLYETFNWFKSGEEKGSVFQAI